jgi:hypothetical protein
MVDHINHNRADNRIINLRLATNAQNKQNGLSHKDKAHDLPKGVFLRKDTGKYEAKICCDRRTYTLGSFHTPEEAHAAYCAKATELFGQFHRPA